MVLEFGIKVDWLTLTKKFATSVTDGRMDMSQLLSRLNYEVSYIGVDTSDFEVVRGDGFYDVHVLYRSSGVRAAANFDTEKQGLRVVFSGQALTGDTYGVRVLASAVENDWKPTRIDLALDMFNTEVSVEAWYWTYMAQHQPNKQRTVQFRHSKGGDTLVLGSRQSEKYARIYDKAAQQGLANDWVRFEIEFKAEAAVGIVPKILADIRACAMLHVAMVSLPHFWLAQYIESFAQGEHISIPRMIKDKDGRARWLNDVVMKVLAKMKVDEPEEYAAFWVGVEEWADGLETEVN